MPGLAHWAHVSGSCTHGCKFASCGDGFIQAGEVCDDGDGNRLAVGAPGCSTFCALHPYCGDGDVQPDLGEECDDANDIVDDECSNQCKGTTCPARRHASR